VKYKEVGRILNNLGMTLRGKKIKHTPVPNNYTKIPNELFGKVMKPTDKLVLMRLYYYPEDWVLAYTRIAEEVGIGKTTIKESWKRLKEKGYIIETDTHFIINLNGSGNDPKAIGTASGLEENQGAGNDHSEVQKTDMSGSVSGHSLVRETTQNGTPNVPNEQDNTKEEKELNKKKEEESVVGDCGVVSDFATQPFGVAPSSPPQSQLGTEKKETVSKYTSNENERLILLRGYSDYLQLNPDSDYTFTTYEDILILVVYGYEGYTNNWEISNWEQVISLLSPKGNIQNYNTHINNYAAAIVKNSNYREKLFNLRQQLISSNK